MRLSLLWHSWMSDGQIAAAGLALTVIIAAAYVGAAMRRSPRGRRWPLHRTLSFLTGLAVIVVALDSGIAAHDETPTVHVVQHVLLMMLAPLLLAAGAPVTLALRTLGRDGRRRLLAVLHEPSVRRLGRRPLLVVIDYAATMVVVMLAPVQHLAERHLAVHIALHAYLLGCGGLFWAVVLARDPVPNRQTARTRVRMVAACVPLAAALAVAVACAPTVFAVPAGGTALTVALTVLIGTLATTAGSVPLILRTAPRRRARAARSHTTRGAHEKRGQLAAPAIARNSLSTAG